MTEVTGSPNACEELGSPQMVSQSAHDDSNFSSISSSKTLDTPLNLAQALERALERLEKTIHELEDVSFRNTCLKDTVELLQNAIDQCIPSQDIINPGGPLRRGCLLGWEGLKRG